MPAPKSSSPIMFTPANPATVLNTGTAAKYAGFNKKKQATPKAIALALQYDEYKI